MIDLHTHILPGVDDGAENLEASLAMLRLQKASGVHRLYLTPHFYPVHQEFSEFLEKREEAWNQLLGAVGGEDLPHMRLGAEVHYSPDILEMDLRRLTLGSGDFLLLEMPHRYYPAYGEQVVLRLLEDGITPILAHVERFSYFRKDPALLKRLIDLGALGQVSADTLNLKMDKGFARACLGCGLAQLVGSDAHNMDDRRPCLKEALTLPEYLQKEVAVFADMVWENEVPPLIRTDLPKKNLFGRYL